MRSESIGKLASALSKAQSKILGALADSANGFFKSKYADLQSVMDAIRGPFAENEIAYSQTINRDETGLVLTTILFHSSGEFIESTYPLIIKDPSNPQAIGSVITYARRYALSAIAGVAQTDDDGNEAAGKVTEQRQDKAPAINKNSNVENSTVKQQGNTEPKQAPYQGQLKPDYKITEAQLKRLYALQHKANLSHAELAKLLSIKTSQTDAKLLMKSEYDVICAILENQN